MFLAIGIGLLGSIITVGVCFWIASHINKHRESQRKEMAEEAAK